MKNFCNSTLDLGLSFQHVVGPIRSTESVSLGIFPKLPLILYNMVYLQLSFIDFLIGQLHIYVFPALGSEGPCWGPVEFICMSVRPCCFFEIICADH